MEEIITPNKEGSTGKKSKGLSWIVVIIILILVGAAVWWYVDKEGIPEIGGRQSAAVVNGYVISTEEFDQRLLRTKTNLELQGVDLSQPGITDQLKKQVTDELVNERLVLQDAEKRGITVDAAAVSEAIAAIKARFPSEDEFKKELEKGKMNEDAWQESVRRELIVQKYIEISVKDKNVTATNEEVKAFYDEYVKQQPKDAAIPKFDEVKAQITTQIQSQKIAAIMQQVLADLKTAAQIEITEDLK